jgi:hypothetical protein
MPESVYSYSYTQPHSLYTVHRTRGRGSLPAAPNFEHTPYSSSPLLLLVTAVAERGAAARTHIGCQIHTQCARARARRARPPHAGAAPRARERETARAVTRSGGEGERSVLHLNS